MVGERRNGNLLVHLGPKLQAYPEELIRQRRGHDGHTEYLIRWSILSLDDSTGSSTNAASAESKTENILMWMSAEEVYANCPTLLGKRKPEGQRVKEEKAPSSSAYPSDVTVDEASLREMKADVRNLVQRAARQMARTTGPESSILNTIHVLSAYASIGSLTGVFKETGALDLLMKMLCNEEKQIRRSAGKMLRALASHDAGSRAYVLLSLSQQDGIEQHMDFDSRYTLLELFAETTSSEEHCMSFEGIHLPQIPGKLLFSLVKRYLCVTSLMDKLNSTTELGGERQDAAAPSANFGEKSRVQREFDFSMAMANLISELVRVMGWDRSQEKELLSLRETQPRVVRSIFQPKGSTCTAVQVPLATSKPSPRKKHGQAFMTLSDFSSRSSYIEYVQENLKPGMMVRMLEDYEEISTGDEGEFRQSNSGMPPVQVLWQSTGRTYWVHWHMVEIIGSGEQLEEEAAQEKKHSVCTLLGETFYCKPLGGLYSLPYLSDQMNENSGTLSRAEWWELLFFIKKLEQHEQQESGCFNSLLSFKLLELDEEGLIQLSMSVELAQQVLHLLDQHCQGCTRNDLHSSHVYLKYSFSKGAAEQSCKNVDMISANCGGPSEAMASEKPKKESLSAEVPSPASSGTEKTDTQLINELLKAEGLSFPDTLDEKAKAFCSVKFTGKRSSLEKLADVIDIIQKSSSEVTLQMAGLSHAQLHTCRITAPFVVPREKMVKMLVELLSNQVKEKLLVVMALRLLYVFMAKYDWRVLFATEGGVRAVLGCMQEYPTSALVQQAGLAALKVLVGAGNCELLGTSGKSYPLNHSDAQMMREIFASIGSASGKDSDNLLCAIRTAIEKMLGTPGILNKFLDSSQEDMLPWHECIEPCLSSMSAHSNEREVVQEFIRFLHRLATTNKDCAVVMCRVGTKEALTKAMDKHNSNLLLVTELRDLVTDCEKYASLYKKMTTSILAGCIQMVLGQIEEHRRSHQPINIPFFDVFLRNLCQGSNVEVKEDKCWERVEVSSNPHRASKLTDRNPKTYWESNGSTGSHYINVYMHRGVVIRQMTLLVASEDSSYMPARIVVMGGENASNITTELNTVNVLPSASRVVLLENMIRFWPIVQIKIKRCQQGGIDTRVRGLEVLGPKPTFWPIFKEQLCRRTYLFYTTKAHTWCQEISEDRMQLLQLFSRLNSALRHEQVFADRFLPDDEAAQALGKTCWEALITPLVQSITSPDPSGISPLSWLLSQYLENVEVARRTKSRAAVFNSRVRRLSHLLVHVDSSSPEPEDLKPPVKSSTAKATVKKPSSTTGITQCWKGVVQQQVKRFLESSWQAPDFVERYCSTYQRLRTAMEELFGQQMSFMLALCHGFSGGLLQLSFLTAMHVSEQFARYIDRWIQESWANSGNVESLQRLQQSLEPILFLAGLELANTFEHFYRYYLGDRLLSQGKTWLETAVVEHIGLCFPNRFPQQMLKNLSELEQQQQQFHLFQLQQLDKHLLELDQRGKQEEEAEEEEEAVVTKELHIEADVKVLALSPRCWTISPLCYLEEPARFFPPSLSQHLSKFADFYTQSECRGVLGPPWPRRLQWTWLGHAELEHQGCVLHVSTLQMYILLCFNDAEVLTASSLSLSLSLCQLNEVTLSQVSGQHLWLLPKQTYLNVEENEASALERKRNIICCLLIQILKEEKEIHIDNLVFRVRRVRMGPCSFLQLVARFLSFCCSSTDVLSCILHLLNQGYIRRQEDNPQLLEYISVEPTTPHRGQAQLIFQSTDLLMETVLLPMGRTMNQEEVGALMTQTVERVSDTLSVTADIAQHLLIHCKWNVDVLIQRYTEDPELLLFSSGLQVRNPQPPSSPVTHCPVCVNPLSQADNPPVLCCMHYCCKSCWNEYLTTRIEQNLILNCTCPISDCPAQPTTDFIRSIISSKEVIAKYEKALLRGYVECCSNLTWCTNPQGCDQILCKEGLGCGEACSKCSWISCFNCNFPEAHYPASCSHMSQWMDDGGFYEGMTVEAQSKHLAKLISKRCPSCQAQIEKNEGCLHMTCAKCNHGFCWRCLKPWKPTHKDYYNCSAMVSKAARQEKRFQDYNERCTFHHQAREFAMNLRNRVSSVSDVPQIRTLTFVVDACKTLEQARKVLAYSCVYSYYNQDTEKMDIMEQQSENLELHTNALQILLEESLLQCQDLASSIRLLKAEHFNTGLELVRRIQERLQAILQHATQDFRVGFQSQQTSEQREIKLSNVPNGSDSPDTDDGGKEEEEDEDEEYVPEWQDEYDDEDLDDDNISYDDESENLERESFLFEDEDEIYD
uniref:Cullin 9 n=1 Tax=Varanus komodoensis TaxID=61221 RepID=A0A8D2L888_VARKO